MKSCCCGFIFISQINLFVSWQLNDIKSELRDFEIIANLTRFESWFSCSLYKNQLLIFKCALKKTHIFSDFSQNNGSQLLDSKKYAFNVMYSLPIQLTG